MLENDYLADIHAYVFAPSVVEIAAVSTDVDHGCLSAVVDQNLPAVAFFVGLFTLQKLDVQVVEYARRSH